jgi:predicted alpha/beta-fold hydrolase
MLDCDWSSDVCSSDLRGGHVGFIGADRRGRPECWSEARVERLLLDAKAERHR